MSDSSSSMALSDRPVPTPAGGELFTEERSAEVVAASFVNTPDPRLKQVLSSLVHHLHAFVKDVELTEEEWGAAITFLTRTGQTLTNAAGVSNEGRARPTAIYAGPQR